METREGPYTENDIPRPLSADGITKLAGEHFVRANAAKHLVIRTCGLYGKNPSQGKDGLNFIEQMLKMANEQGEVQVVDDEVVSPTSTAELAEQLVQLSLSNDYELYHAAAEGHCSWYELAQEIFAQSDIPVRLRVAGSDGGHANVSRPRYSPLENQALKSKGLNILNPWRSGLHTYLAGRGKSECRRRFSA